MKKILFAVLMISAFGAAAQSIRPPGDRTCGSCVPGVSPWYWGGGALAPHAQAYQDNLGKRCTGRICRGG